MAVLTALLVLAGSAWALDLPVKSVKGKQYYYHKVKKGESLYGISRQLDIPVDKIIEDNPEAAGGIRKGDILVFPYEEYQTPVEKAEADTIKADTAVMDSVKARPIIGVLLPFGLEAEEPARRNNIALDFYKGVLIAADSLSKRAGEIEIVTHDTEGLAPDALRDMISRDSLLRHASVIIGPDDEASIAAIAEAAATGSTYVLNIFNTRDSSYTDTPRLMQANLPQKQMYTLAVDAIMADFDGFRPVILRNKAGHNDREAFTTYLTGRYLSEGIEPVTIEYETNLLLSDLETLPVAYGEKYIIVPSDGSVGEFNRFAYALRTFRDRIKEEAFATADVDSTATERKIAEIEVFGYPDWTAFRGDALDMLHRLNATVYSRFLDNTNGFNARNIDSDFKRWYGTPMMESVPVYGILGFDTASYLIRNLRAHDGTFEPLDAVPFSGIQSTFDFISAGEGFVNNSLYIITYQTGGRLSAHVQ